MFIYGLQNRRNRTENVLINFQGENAFSWLSRRHIFSSFSYETLVWLFFPPKCCVLLAWEIPRKCRFDPLHGFYYQTCECVCYTLVLPFLSSDSWKISNTIRNLRHLQRLIRKTYEPRAPDDNYLMCFSCFQYIKTNFIFKPFLFLFHFWLMIKLVWTEKSFNAERPLSSWNTSTI